VRFVPKLYLWLMARALKRIIKAGNFDALIVADSGAKKSYAFFLGSPQLTTWTVFHGSEVESYFGSATTPFALLGGASRMRRFLLRVDGCVAVSEWMRIPIVRELPELEDKCWVVHHGVEIDKRALLMSRRDAKGVLGIDNATQVVFSASRLIAEKGPDVLIRAFAMAIRRVPDIRLLIAGDGPVRSELESLAHTEGVQDQVVFLGQIDHEEMRCCFRACEIFAQPTRFQFESFGLVYLEANSCERVVIAGNVAGVPESVADGISGLLVDPLDVDGISQAIVGLLEDEERREKMEQSAFQRVSEEFRLEQMAQRTVDLVFPAGLP
jgi:glycosyltransferase involved in cell wall biosynthesis